MRTVFQSSDEQLSGKRLADIFKKSNDVKEKVIALGNYEGFYLRMHCRSEDAFTRAEGNGLVGRILKPVDGGRQSPYLDISIASSGVRKTNSNVSADDIILPDQRQAAQDLAERIAGAFTPMSSRP